MTDTQWCVYLSGVVVFFMRWLYMKWTEDGKVESVSVFWGVMLALYSWFGLIMILILIPPSLRNPRWRNRQ